MAQPELTQLKYMIIKSVCSNAASMAELCKTIASFGQSKFPKLAVLAKVVMILTCLQLTWREVVVSRTL